MQLIEYKVNVPVEVKAVIDLFKDAGLDRPITDPACIQQMIENANLIVSAWDGEQLIGLARSLTDFCYCTYLSDIAVKKDYQKQKI
ncbi:MAG: GNAT family N-acetyltransferase, partial [Bacteroidota bacterium]